MRYLTEPTIPARVYPAIRLLSHSTGNPFPLFSEKPVLLYTRTGLYEVESGDQRYQLGCGQLLYLRQGLFVSCRSLREDSSMVYFQWSSADIAAFAARTRLPETRTPIAPPLFFRDAPEPLQRYVSSLSAYFQQQESILAELAGIKVLELFYCISVHDPQLLVQVLQSRDGFRNDLSGLVEEHLYADLTVGQLARLAGRSISSLRRDFLSVYQMSPTRWIRRRKLEKAEELLLGTNLPVTDICYHLGFESLAHFSRVFKARFRQSPSQYRLVSRRA